MELQARSDSPLTLTVTSPLKLGTGENNPIFQFDLWTEAKLAAKVWIMTILLCFYIAVICFPSG